MLSPKPALQIASADSFQELASVLATLAAPFGVDPEGCTLWVGRDMPLRPYGQPSAAPAGALRALERDEPDVSGRHAHFPLQHAGERQGVWELRFGQAPSDAALAELAQYVPHCALAVRNLGKYMQLEAMVEHELLTSVEHELAMQLVLDSMRDGLLVSNRDGSLSAVRSRTVETWFGTPAPEQAVWDYLAAHAPVELADKLRSGFEQMFEDVLPFALCADQMPAQLRRDGRLYRLDYQRVEQDGAFKQVAISISDVTRQVEMEQAEAAQRELVGILTGLLHNRDGFALFLQEMRRLLSALLLEEDETVMLRLVHTLKGDSAIHGFRGFAALCHSVESRLLAGEASAPLVEQLEAAWADELERIAAFVENDNVSNEIVVAREEYDELLAMLHEEPIRHFVRRWCHPTFGGTLDPALRAALRLAKSQGKQVDVQLQGGLARLPSLQLQPFLSSLVHVLRNAVDHGIETEAERQRAGKPPVARLWVHVDATHERVAISVEDDGRGIDWARLRERASERGLGCSTDHDLLEVLFCDGVSTANAVTAISGRGVGLSAVRAECLRLGGTVAVRSRHGEGTTFSFEFLQANSLSRAPLSRPVSEPAAPRP